MSSSIRQVETAVPAFVGYTEKHIANKKTLRYKPTRVTSLLDFELKFGRAESATIQVKLKGDNTLDQLTVKQPTSILYCSLSLFFANGGRTCYVVSLGNFKTAKQLQATRIKQFQKALAILEGEDEPTLLCFPDLHTLQGEAASSIMQESLRQSAVLRDRLAILDVPLPAATATTSTAIADFRRGIGAANLSFGAAYFPWLESAIYPFVDESSPSTATFKGGNGLSKSVVLKKPEGGSHSLFHTNRPTYDQIMKEISLTKVLIPPSAAVAATCAKIDDTMGVWKSPTNYALANIIKPVVLLSNTENEMLNIDSLEGKSINAIRTFAGKGTMIWGARTLAGNDNEWRYVPVRRFFMMVEESIKKEVKTHASGPNTSNTWASLRGLIENFLINIWKMGALMGAKPSEAFYVRIGLGQTMTAQDIADGRLIVEIGMAAVRPAEFIMLRMIQQMANP